MDVHEGCPRPDSKDGEIQGETVEETAAGPLVSGVESAQRATSHGARAPTYASACAGTPPANSRPPAPTRTEPPSTQDEAHPPPSGTARPERATKQVNLLTQTCHTCFHGALVTRAVCWRECVCVLESMGVCNNKKMLRMNEKKMLRMKEKKV